MRSKSHSASSAHFSSLYLWYGRQVVQTECKLIWGARVACKGRSGVLMLAEGFTAGWLAAGKGLTKDWRQLSTDIAAANACLPPHLHLPPLPPPARRPSEQELRQHQAQGQPYQRQHQLSQELPEQLSVGNSSELQTGYSSGVGSGGLYSTHLRRPLSPAKSDAGWSDISGVTSTM